MDDVDKWPSVCWCTDRDNESGQKIRSVVTENPHNLACRVLLTAFIDDVL